MDFRNHHSNKRFFLMKQMNDYKKKVSKDNERKQNEVSQKDLTLDEWKAWKQDNDRMMEAKESDTNETLTQIKYEEWRLEEERKEKERLEKEKIAREIEAKKKAEEAKREQERIRIEKMEERKKQIALKKLEEQREKERVEKEQAFMDKEDKETKDKIRQEKEIIRKEKYEAHKRLIAQKKEAMEIERARANHERQLMTEEDNTGKAIVRKEKERIWRIKKEEWRKQKAIEHRERMKKQHELMVKHREEKRLRKRQQVSFQLSSFAGSVPKPVVPAHTKPLIQEIEEDIFIKNIVVVSTPVLKDNHDIEHHMRSLGFNVNTIYHYPKGINNKTIYIFLYFYPTIRHHQYPKYYIIWQIEQLCATNQVMNALTQEKIKIMNGALQIYEISMKHYNTIYSEQIPRNKIYYCPLPFYHVDQNADMNPDVEKDLDCVFIGANNARRHHILTSLREELEKRNITLHIYHGIFGDEKIDILKRAKYILNIHYYDNASLETHRINEALHYDCITISEDVVDDSDGSTKNTYANTVLFNPIIEEDKHMDIYVDSIEANLKAETYHENMESIHIHKETLSEHFSKLMKENAFACDKLIDLNVKNKISNKDDFRHICDCNLPLIRNILIPDIPNECHYEAFYIEFRQFTHAEFLIRNAVIKLPQWAHTVICGNKNFESLSKICNSISPHITVLKLDIDNLNTAEYSRLLLTKEFWNQFKGEKLLLYQEDSFLFHNQIEPFLEYDYIGAPWPIHQDENIDQKKYGVGNGGFSLRSKSKMMECIDKIDWQKDLELGPRLKRYMIATNNYIIPEDVYFSKALLEKGIGNVAPRDVAVHFSQETQKSPDPLGGHNFYLGDNYKLPNYNTLYLNNNLYYKNVNHRGGWKLIIQYGLDNNIICDKYKKSQSIILEDCCESYFFGWGGVQPVSITNKWIGITHFTDNVPKHWENCHIDNLLNNNKFIKSLDNCVGLIVLSNYMKKYFSTLEILKNIPIYSLKHPIDKPDHTFNLDKFLSFDKFKLILLGQQIRNFSDAFKINSLLIYEKIWLSGIIHKKTKEKLLYNDLFNNKIVSNYESFFEITKFLQDSYITSFKDYDHMMTTSVILIPLYNASANNSVLEIIQTNTPAFITRLPATEEYLGKGYPMFYSDVIEVNNILNNRELFNKKYTETHNYLKNMDKSDLKYKRFYSDLLKIINDVY